MSRALQDPNVWPIEALIERYQDTEAEILRRMERMGRTECRDYGFDPEEIWERVVLPSLLTSIRGWNRAGSKRLQDELATVFSGQELADNRRKVRHPIGYAKLLLRLRLKGLKQQVQKRTKPLSLDAPLEGSEVLTLGESIRVGGGIDLAEAMLDVDLARQRMADSWAAGDSTPWEGLKQAVLDLGFNDDEREVA